MRGFWKKAVSLSLAAVLAIGVMPAASAVEHRWANTWSKDETNHWYACLDCSEKKDLAAHDFREVSNTPATCYQEGKTVSRCTVCGYEQTVVSGATGNHVYDDRWTADNDYHWHACTTNGCTATSGKAAHVAKGEGVVTNPTCTAAGTITYTCEICNKTYTRVGSPAMGHSYVNGKCTRCGATDSSVQSGKNFSITVTSAGRIGTTLRSEINSIFRSVTGSTVTRVRFGSSSGTSYGRIYTNSGKTALSTSRDYYYSNSNYGYYPLSDVYFVPSSSGVFRIAYTAYNESGSSVSGTISIVTDAGSSGGTIRYTVAPEGKVALKRSDFKDAFDDACSSTLRWVEFYTDDTLSASRGTLYYDYKGSDEKAFTSSNLDAYSFYYSSDRYGDYALDDLTYVAGSTARTVTLHYTAYGDDDETLEGTVEIKTSATGGDIVYEVQPGEQVEFDRTDFNKFFQEEYDGTVQWVEFYTDDTFSSSVGYLYYDYDGEDQERFDEDDISSYCFYYSRSAYGDYPLNSLSFVAGSRFDEDIRVGFTAYSSDDEYVEGTVVLTRDEKASSTKKGNINYEVAPGEQVAFDRTDFNKFFDDAYDGEYALRWVTFSSKDDLNKYVGYLYWDYEGEEETRFDDTDIDAYSFYYSSDRYGDYSLNGLSFVAGDDFDEEITLNFTAFYDDGEYAEGTLVIAPEGQSVSGEGDIIYTTTYSSNVQINANDIARFLQETYPGSTLNYVTLKGAPSAGSLYYNYYSASSYGGKKERVTSSNYKDYTFYFSPSSTKNYALSELTYIPSGFNYCATIPFTAYGSGSRSVSGTILISVSQKSTVSEVYGVTPKNSAVTFPASAILVAVNAASGLNLDSISLLELPDKDVGTVYEGTGTSVKADTTTKYGYSSGSVRISQLRFVPAEDFTGSVEIPYVAYNADGDAIASGNFCLGVVSGIKVFSDVTSSTWCYKYVTELSDAKVIDGYTDGKFRPDNNVTYGQALKLIMLATGYKTQTPTGSHPFSGYLDRARSDGLISGTVNLDAPITRLAVAQIAAKAMKLSTTDLSSVKPFTDTSDVYVQTLNAAGIVEGYFSNGTSTYKPGNYLTRGQISAIVWRMERAN